MIGKVKLTGGNKCPICGEVFTATPPLRPNVTDREFYGGRVKFFKKVECTCDGEYDLCIEKKYNSAKCEEEFNVINMIVLKEGDELTAHKRRFGFIPTGINDNKEETVDVDKITEEVKQEAGEPLEPTVLAQIVDDRVKRETMNLLTIKELRGLCRDRKIEYKVIESKKELIAKLIEADPGLVVSNPEG